MGRGVIFRPKAGSARDDDPTRVYTQPGRLKSRVLGRDDPGSEEGATRVLRGEGHPCTELGGATLDQRGEGQPCSERGKATSVQRFAPPPSCLEKGAATPFSKRGGATPVQRGEGPPVFREGKSRGRATFVRRGEGTSGRWLRNRDGGFEIGTIASKSGR